MPTAPKTHRNEHLVPWGDLPPRMRVLFITGSQQTGEWLAEALSADSASEIVLEQKHGVAAGLAQLRDDVFDAVIISHEPPEVDALDLIDGIHAGCGEQLPILVLGVDREADMADLVFEAGADAYICANTTTTRTLIWQLARARERSRLIAENRRLTRNQTNRLKQEHDEADRLLKQQRAIIQDLERIRLDKDTVDEMDGPQPAGTSKPDATCPPGLPAWLVAHYRELLRTYIVMGTGNLSDEMERLTNQLASAGTSAQQAMQLHLHVLEEMVDGLGSRSARHVMNRADLLVLEVMIHLAEGYRSRLNEPATTS